MLRVKLIDTVPQRPGDQGVGVPDEGKERAMGYMFGVERDEVEKRRGQVRSNHVAALSMQPLRGRLRCSCTHAVQIQERE